MQEKLTFNSSKGSALAVIVTWGTFKIIVEHTKENEYALKLFDKDADTQPYMYIFRNNPVEGVLEIFEHIQRKHEDRRTNNRSSKY